MGYWRTGTDPAWFQWGCASVVVFPMAWGTCPHGSCHTGAVAVGVGSSLGCVKAEEDLFQKKDNFPEKENLGCSGAAE